MKVTVFIKTDNVCRQCDAVKRKLVALGVPFEEISVDKSPEAKARVQKLDYLSAPVTLVEREDGTIDHRQGYDPEWLKTLAAA